MTKMTPGTTKLTRARHGISPTNSARDPSVKDIHDIERDEVSFFAKYYKDAAYNRTGSRLRFRRELSSLRRHLKGLAGNVLSIGCGDGEFEFMLSPYANRITALDLSQESIQIARSRAAEHGAANVDFRCQSLRDLQWDRPYDMVVCLALLHHVSPEELPAFLAGIYGSLVPGGFFYAEDPNVHGLLRKIGRLVLREKVSSVSFARRTRVGPF
jgi:2-polyprenyl-3-methyl-5-hydroxy-6-metoxy-1,4-benzoquinol methylase